MKRVTIILAMAIMLMLTTTAWAATNVSFQWDANTEPDLAGYNIYQSDISGVYDISKLIGTVDKADCCQFTKDGVPDGTWFWVATAFDTFGNESGYSNEVTDTLNTEPPAPPQNLSIWQKIIAWLKHLINWG